MPTICAFDGILIRMYAEGGERHHTPHIHVAYQGACAELDFEGNVLAGSMPEKQLRKVQVWIDMRQKELLTNWELISAGQQASYIDPIR